MKTRLPQSLIRSIAALLMTAACATSVGALDNPSARGVVGDKNSFKVISQLGGKSMPLPIYVDKTDFEGVKIAARNLSADFGRVCGTEAQMVSELGNGNYIIAGSLESPVIKRLVSEKKIDGTALKGKREKYIMTVIDNPTDGVDRALVIAGSDKRGAIYGIYELSELIGVSPWWDWADVPAEKHSELAINPGVYTAGEPAVKYRGIFLNDEGPCLMDWVKNTYGTDYGDHRFYSRVFELILRLRGNYLWPAMWAWEFYADDAENGRLADEMGVIIGTSHHEPMARSHKEWARNQGKYGPWNYHVNPKGLNRFFAEGIARMNGREDVITIGMRGDGDEAMSEEADVKLLKKVIANQRRIIERETGRPAKETPQVWALYKEVLDYYDKGLRVPDDVIMLLCDDNWGNVRRLPNDTERKHPGGWGMYYHVDYVGAPRNSKLLNCTPIQNMWEQMNLTYDYGVDKLWILNVGDLKPMEYPITLFLDMAWNPKKYGNETLLNHTRNFFGRQFGADQADEAARIFNLLCKYNGRCTPELLDADTYKLSTGEWKQVRDEFLALEAEALRQYNTLDPQYRDAYKELLLFPLQVMANLYDMYYSVAMNRALWADGMPEANMWADRAEACFKRDGQLMNEYNNVIAGGKWNGMMHQKHIGYTDWSDNFPADKMPEVHRVDAADYAGGGFIFDRPASSVSIEAPHFFKAVNPQGEACWTVLPFVGRTLGGVAVMPYTVNPQGASITYKMQLPAGTDSVSVHVVTKSTLAFARPEGHRYTVAVNGQDAKEVNFNGNLNEAPQNIHTVYYPTIARRVVEKVVKLPVGTPGADGYTTVTLSPLDPGIVFEKIVVDGGGYERGYLFGNESHCTRK